MSASRLRRTLSLFLLLAVTGLAKADVFLPVRAERKPFVLEGPGDYVVVVHGWAWFRDTMRPTAQFLNRQGFSVVCVRYDSRTEMPDDVVEKRIRPVVAEYCTDPARKIHFVSHSMGGLMIREYVARHRPANLGRSVLLAPPNQGIEAVDRVKDWKLFASIFGEPARLLGTDAEALAPKLGPADFPLGVVMGRGVGLPLVSAMLPGPDDGVVAVASGRVEGMADFTTVLCGHVGLPAHPVALAQTLAFLRDGSFDQKMSAKEMARTKRFPALDVRVGGK